MTCGLRVAQYAQISANSLYSNRPRDAGAVSSIYGLTFEALKAR